MVENAIPAIEISKRIKTINSKKPDIVVSIHANAFGSNWNTANGWEIYCNDPKEDLAEGTKLAKSIHNQSIKMLGLRDRGIKDAHGVSSIVTKTIMPAVLIEHGFYTNKEELKKLQSKEFRKKCAIADTKGILEYLGIVWKEETNKMGTVNTTHWADKHLDSLVKKGLINSPETHRNSLDEPITKGQIFALLDRITEVN